MPLTDKQWKEFLPALKSRNCCLLMGPELSCARNGQNESITVLQAFSDFMGKRLTEEGIAFDNTIDNFYYRANKFIGSKYPGQSFRFEEEIKNFVTDTIEKPNEYFSKLVRLPFNTIVNMVPDNFTNQALTAQGYEFAEDYYDYSKAANERASLPEEMQLVFNLFGTYQFAESVAVTEKDQLTLIKNIVAGLPRIPTNLTTRFADKKKSFLFIGFNFNDWYFRLVIDALQIPKPVQSYYPVYSNVNKVAFLNQEFYTEKFGIQFVDTDTEAFIADLIQRYENDYGPLDRKLKMVIDYVDKDADVHGELKVQLQLNSLSKRMEFWSKDDIEAGGKLTEVDDRVKTADVYVPLLSKYFINDNACLVRIQQALQQPNTKVIPILSGYAAYDAALPTLKKNSLLVLPRDNMPLQPLTAAELSKKCVELATTINCIIR
jgi:hypothetical protein